MNKIKMTIIVLTIISSSSFASENKGAVVLNTKSWTTSGNDPTIHVVDGHLAEKKRNKWFLCFFPSIC